MNMPARLQNQPRANPNSDQRRYYEHAAEMQTFNVNVKVGEWEQVLVRNTSRRFLQIQNRGGEQGPCSVQMVFDRKDINDAFNIDMFAPHVAPINAIYVYVSDPNNTGSTTVNIQVIEG